MTRATRNLSVQTDTPQGSKSTLIAGGAWELFDATEAADFDIFIPDDTVLLSADLRLKVKPWRSFEKDVSSGGGSTSGASSASSSASGGSSTPTSSTQAAHRHQMTNGNQTALGLANKLVFAQNSTGSAQIGFDLATNASALHTFSADGSHDHTVTIAAHDHGIAHTHTTPNHVHSIVKGVFRETAYPGAVSISLNGVDISHLIGAPFTASAGNDTFEVSLAGVLTSPGWHTFTASTASGKGRVQAFIPLSLLTLQ